MVNFIPHCGEKTGEQAARLFKKEKTTNGQEARSPVSTETSPPNRLGLLSAFAIFDILGIVIFTGKRPLPAGIHCADKKRFFPCLQR
jgi:hypothetical protein